jgi:hypothetical protein
MKHVIKCKKMNTFNKKEHKCNQMIQVIKLDMLKSTCPRWLVGQVDKMTSGSFTKFSSQVHCDLLEWYYFDKKLYPIYILLRTIKIQPNGLVFSSI